MKDSKARSRFFEVFQKLDDEGILKKQVLVAIYLRWLVTNSIKEYYERKKRIY